jgi:predicted aldo/keto reductase-like oxidoreductase
LERSIQRLNVDKINFYHIWCITSMEVWKARQGGVKAALKAKEQGLIEHVCVSSHMPGEELAEILKEGWFDGVTLGYCAINFPYRQAAVDLAGKMGLGVIAMNPLAGGLIPQNAQRFDFIRSPGDADVVQAALRFNTSNPHLTSSLVGFSKPQHVDQSVAAVKDFQPCPPAHFDALRSRIVEQFNGLCTGCGYCMPCPKGIEVPKMMDAFNMRVLMGEDDNHIINRLKWHWGQTPDKATACTLCGACETRCTQHLPIRQRMKTIGAIKIAK